MQDISPITPRDKATEQRRRDYERLARSIACQFWLDHDPQSLVPNIARALEQAYTAGREDQAFGRNRRSVA
jgi:hypothetical protein